MAADVGHIAQLLQATLDPAQHRTGMLRFSPLPRLRCKREAREEPKSRLQRPPCTNERRTTLAEAALKQEAAKPQYSLTLLTIVSNDALPINTRLGAALAFKNFIRINYVVSHDAIPCHRRDCDPRQLVCDT